MIISHGMSTVKEARKCSQYSFVASRPRWPVILSSAEGQIIGFRCMSSVEDTPFGNRRHGQDDTVTPNLVVGVVCLYVGRDRVVSFYQKFSKLVRLMYKTEIWYKFNRVGDLYPLTSGRLRGPQQACPFVLMSKVLSLLIVSLTFIMHSDYCDSRIAVVKLCSGIV